MSDEYTEYTEHTNRLERRTRFTMPAMMLALICGGFAVAGIWPPTELTQDPYLSWLASPVFVSLCLLGTAAFATLSVFGIRADNRLWNLADEQDRRVRRNLMRRFGGEEFARRWEARPPIRNRVRGLRRQRDIDPEDLARLLDYSPQFLALLERAHYPPDLRTALMLSDLFGVPVDALFWTESAAEFDGAEHGNHSST